MTEKQCQRCSRTLDTRFMKMDRFGNDRFWQCDRSKDVAIWAECLHIDPNEIHFEWGKYGLDKDIVMYLRANAKIKMKRWFVNGDITEKEYYEWSVIHNDQ